MKSHAHCWIFHSFMPACIHLFTQCLLEASLCQAPGWTEGMWGEQTLPALQSSISVWVGRGERIGDGAHSARPHVNSAGLDVGHTLMAAQTSSSSNIKNIYLKGENLKSPRGDR